MSSIQAQVESPDLSETTQPGTTRPGTVSILTESTERWAICDTSSSNSANPVKGPANRPRQRPSARELPSWIPALAALLLTGVVAQAQAVFSTPQPVGVTAGQQNVTVTAQAAGTVATVQVLTGGVPNLDFTAGSGLQNCVTTLAKGATCTESVTFTPSAPGVRIGAVVLLDSNSNVLGTAFLSGTGLGGLGVLVSGNMPDIAGQGRLFSGPLGDGGPALQASLDLPAGLALDGAANLYIADSLHYRIRLVNAKTGIISTFAGNGTPGYTGDYGPAVGASMNTPSGVAVDGAGNVYIADTGNNVVRKVAASTGIITTVAGNGAPGSATNVGDGGPATAANLNNPQGVTVDVAGNLFIADTSHHRIRRVDAVSGIITTVAGNGTATGSGAGGFSGDGGQAISAELNYPFTVAFDFAGNMYIPDSANNRIRMVSASGIISTFAGTGTPAYTGDGAAATLAALWTPEGVIADPAGNVYIADTQNAAVRKVNALTGDITTIAVNAGTEDLFNGNLYELIIYGPIGIEIDDSGNIYVANYFNQDVQQIQSNLVVLDFRLNPVRQGEESSPIVQTVENDGNAPFDITGITIGTNLALDPATTTCALSPPSMSVDEDCEAGVVFAPSKTLVIPPPATQETVIDNIDVAGVTVNTPLDIEVWGIATVVNATTTTLTSSFNPSGFGQTVSFIATVITGSGTGALTGTVTFYYDGTAFPGTAGCANPVTLTAQGTATCATTALTVGTHQITATYTDTSSPPSHFSSTSAELTQVVLEGTTTKLTSSGSPSAAGQSVTFTATVTSAGGNIAPDGNVVFYDGSTLLGSSTLTLSGMATFTTSTLASGTHMIVAFYGGDSVNNIQPSQGTFIQDVQGGSTVIVTSSPNPSNYGIAVIFSISIPETQSVNAQGSVTIYDGGIQIGTALLTGGAAPQVGGTGQATFTASTLAVGTHSITVTFPGDTSYASGTSAVLTQVVNQAQTATAVAAAPNPAFAGGAIVFTATVKLTQGVNVPTGTVSFTSGTVILGSAAVSTSGTATINTTLVVGSYSVVATYSGDVNDAGSASSPLSLGVQIATTSSAVTANPNPAAVDSPMTFTAKVMGNGGIPTGSVTFFADGVSIATANLDATGTATISSSSLPAGTHSITASYSGDASDLPSTSPPIGILVTTIPTATALGTTSTSGANSQVVLVATVIGAFGPVPTGTVTFSSVSGAVSTVIGMATLDSSGVATLNPNLASGAFSIVAAYGGDALHAPSTSLTVSVLGAPSGFTITVNPPAITVAVTQNATATLTFTSIAGFSDTLGLGCASLPSAVTCHFSSPSVVLAANGTQTAQVTIDTNDPLSGGAAAMNAHGGSRGADLAGLSILSLPLTAFFGLILRRFRKRHGPVFTVAILFLLFSAGMLLNGCNSFTQATAAPGTYVIQITATGVSSDVIHYQNVTLTITQ
jgi:large repetitive protein